MLFDQTMLCACSTYGPIVAAALRSQSAMMLWTFSCSVPLDMIARDLPPPVIQ